MAKFCQSYIPFETNTKQAEFTVECSQKAVEHLHRLGHTVVLYTDAAGAELFKDCKYDKVNVMEGGGFTASPAFFAGVKYAACEREPLSTIFIDNDVIITKDDCIDRVLSLKCDVVCQQADIDDFGYNRPREFLVPAVKDAVKIDALMSVSNNGLNCTLIKFNSDALKQRYLSDRKLLMERIMMSNVYQRFGSDKTFNWEIFVEQWYLRNLCITEKYRFLTLDRANGSHFIDKLGYFHFNGAYGTKTPAYFKEMYESRIGVLERTRRE